MLRGTPSKYGSITQMTIGMVMTAWARIITL